MVDIHAIFFVKVYIQYDAYYKVFVVQIFRKEPFFYGHDNYDQLVKIAKVCEMVFINVPVRYN